MNYLALALSVGSPLGRAVSLAVSSAGAVCVAAAPSVSAAPLQLGCEFGPQIHVMGTVASVSQAPAAPFAGVAIGDAFDMSMTFGGDVLCDAAFGDVGYLSDHGCAEMTVGGVTVFGDPMITDPCIWGERYLSMAPFGADAVVADVPFVAGDVRAVLELVDPQALVGIALPNIIDDTIFVPSVTEPGFTARLTLQDAAGIELVVIDLAELSGTPGLTTNNYCNANANSTGDAAFMAFQGSPFIADNDARLVAIRIPADSFSFFIVSDTQGFITNPGGSAGNLCLAGNIGRYVGPGEIQNSGKHLFVSLPIDLTQVPQSNGFVPTVSGMTWNFSAWFRDVVPGGPPTSNFADGISLTFQ